MHFGAVYGTAVEIVCPVLSTWVSHPECLPKKDKLRRIVEKMMYCLFPSVGFLNPSTICVWVFRSHAWLLWHFLSWTFPWTPMDVEHLLRTAVWRITLLLLVWACCMLASLALPNSFIRIDDVHSVFFLFSCAASGFVGLHCVLILLVVSLFL